MKINFESEEQKQFYYQKYAVGVMRARIIIEIVLGVLVMVLFPLLSKGDNSLAIGIVVGVICLISAFVYYLRLRKTYKQIAEDLEKDKKK